MVAGVLPGFVRFELWSRVGECGRTLVLGGHAHKDVLVRCDGFRAFLLSGQLESTCVYGHFCLVLECRCRVLALCAVFYHHRILHDLLLLHYRVCNNQRKAVILSLE